jgi:hypothetical protein
MASFSTLALPMCRPGVDGLLPLCKGRTVVTRWAFLVLMLLLVPSLGRAEDLQQTIGLLPDAASECYYVQVLVKSAQATAQGAERAREDSEAAEAAGDLRLASNKMTIASLVLTATTESWAAVSAALQAIESKHGVLPACAVPLKEEGRRERQEALEKTDHYKQRVASLTERMKRS